MRNIVSLSIVALVFAATSAACSKDAPPPAAPPPPPVASAEPAPAPPVTSAAPVASAAPDAAVAAPAPAETPVPSATDTFETKGGPLKVTPIHHASILFEYGGKEIYVDPWTEGHLDGLPKADYIFISDIHPDHLDAAAIDKLKKDGTVLVGPPAVNEKRTLGVVLKNGASHDFGGFKVEAVPMYNLTRGPEAGKLFHDKGRGDGFVFTFGDKRVYISGDTECIPEMKALKKIDVAFVCMNLPYTMPPEEAAACVKAFKPKVVFPYHFRGQDPSAFAALVGAGGSASGGGKADAGKPEGIETRVRTWY